MAETWLGAVGVCGTALNIIMDVSFDDIFNKSSSEDVGSVNGHREEKHCFDFIRTWPSYNMFYRRYLHRISACIISCSAIESWEARKGWARNGEPCLQEMTNDYGTWLVPVANCSQKYFDSQMKSQQTLQEYVQYMKQEEKRDCLYLKDWHFHGEQRRRHPDRPPVYRTPALLASDWLNEYWEARPHRRDDYRFVYIGVAGSWTPFHADVLRSFSWSANICGRKRWIMLPPGEERKLRSPSGLPYDVAAVLGAESHAGAVSSSDGKTERLQPVTSPDGVLYYDVIQEEGEVMFVPSGWHHQVWNLRDTISINHNWFNGSNAHIVVDFLLASLEEVKAELSDIADGSAEWLSQCQVLLKATHGMDVAELCDLLCFTARRRLDALSGGAVLEGLDGWRYSNDHIRSDLKVVGEVLRRLSSLEEMQRLESLNCWQMAVAEVLSHIGALD